MDEVWTKCGRSVVAKSLENLVKVRIINKKRERVGPPMAPPSDNQLGGRRLIRLFTVFTGLAVYRIGALPD